MRHYPLHRSVHGDVDVRPVTPRGGVVLAQAVVVPAVDLSAQHDVPAVSEAVAGGLVDPVLPAGVLVYRRRRGDDVRNLKHHPSLSGPSELRHSHLVDTVTAARQPGVAGASPDGGAARHGLRPALAGDLPAGRVDLAVVVVLTAHPGHSFLLQPPLLETVSSQQRNINRFPPLIFKDNSQSNLTRGL